MPERHRMIREFEILLAMLEHGNDAGVRETSEALHLPSTTVHRILSMLHREGYVSRSPAGRYSAGVELVRMALLVLQRVDQRVLIHDCLARAVEATGETCVLNVVGEDPSQTFVMDVVLSGHPLQYRLNPGDRHHITAGASGQGALAFMSPEIQRQVLRQAPPRYTAATLQDPAALMERLRLVRARGYAFTKGEQIEGAVGISVPVFIDPNGGQIIGDVSATIPRERFMEDMVPAVVRALRVCARELTAPLAMQFGATGGKAASPWVSELHDVQAEPAARRPTP